MTITSNKQDEPYKACHLVGLHGVYSGCSQPIIKFATIQRGNFPYETSLDECYSNELLRSLFILSLTRTNQALIEPLTIGLQETAFPTLPYPREFIHWSRI